jgi:hypothetical protein
MKTKRTNRKPKTVLNWNWIDVLAAQQRQVAEGVKVVDYNDGKHRG